MYSDLAVERDTQFCFFEDQHTKDLPRKQNFVSLSTAEAEYIAAGSCCAQLLWMKQTLKDYGINVKNVLKGDISIEHVKTEEQLADIFTKPLDEKRFCKLWCELNILESSNVL